MLLSIVIALVCQVQPGPLDAFRANYASIKVEMDFEFGDGHFDGKAVELWLERRLDFRQDRASRIVGQWASDGETEFYRFGPSDEMLERAQRNPPRREANKLFVPAHYVPMTEALWDGHILACHTRDPVRDPAGLDFSWHAIQVDPIDAEPHCLTAGRGPFYWGFSYAFPQIVKARFPGVAPLRRKSMREGHPVEVEVYQVDYPEGGWFRFEVSYDPALGHLPRFARAVSLSSANHVVGKEMYLIEARPCKAGGFVPTEWFTTFVSIARFSERFPNYDDDAILTPEARVDGGYFRAVKLKDRSGPVALTDLNGVTTLSTPGGWLPLRKTGPLTLAMIKQLAGRNLTNPPRQPVLPSLDATELHEFDPPEPTSFRSMTWWTLGIAGVGLVYYLGWRRRRTLRQAAAVIVFLAAFAASGCGMSGPPVVKLNAAFKDTYVFVDPGVTDLAMTLLLRNDGNQPLRLFKADGGCSCRKVDQSRLPCLLTPGSQMSLPVAMTAPRDTAPQNSGFEFETDQGVLGVHIPYFCLVSHQIAPDGSQATLNEGDDWTFELTHRTTYRDTDPKPSPAPVFPREFTVSKTGTRDGVVGGAPEFRYGDTTYRLTLNEHDLGLRKAYITLKDSGGRPLLEVPLTWSRLPFLHTTPDRVALGSHPVRVFLRCPDEAVELTRVLSVPKGVKALVSSPRELTVSLSNDAPSIIDGMVEVGTTAQGRGPLRVPIVRFSAVASN